MNDTPSDKPPGATPAPDKPTTDKADAAAAKQRHQEALKHALEKKRQMQHEAHQHQAAKPKFAQKFSPTPIRRGPRGG